MINISNLLWRSKEMIFFFFKAKTIYKVHSPFLFRLVQRVLEQPLTYYEEEAIQVYQNQLSKTDQFIEKLDRGAGSSVAGNNNTTSVKHLANISSASPFKGRMLFHLINEYQLSSILEFGTCLGIGTAYMAKANSSSKIISIEACPNTLVYAKKTLDHLKINQVELINATFEEYLGKLEPTKKFDFIYLDGHHAKEPTIAYFHKLLPHMDPTFCIVVVDDIYWSKGMNEAWKILVEDESFQLSLDFFQFGVLIRNSALTTKEHYPLIQKKFKPWISGFFSN